MSSLMVFGLIFLSAYLLQSFLTFKQVKAFNRVFQEFRRQGKVVTGKKSGRFVAGTVILFAIDDDGVIINGAMMQGVSVFADFKPLQTFNGERLIRLNDTHAAVKPANKLTRLAIENAREVYIRFLTNTMPEDHYSPVSPFGLKLSTSWGSIRNKLQKTK